MTGLTEQLPHTAAFPNALGTGLLLHTASALGGDLHQHIEDLISDYENVCLDLKVTRLWVRCAWPRTAAHSIFLTGR